MVGRSRVGWWGGVQWDGGESTVGWWGGVEWDGGIPLPVYSNDCQLAH